MAATRLAAAFALAASLLLAEAAGDAPPDNEQGNAAPPKMESQRTAAQPSTEQPGKRTSKCVPNLPLIDPKYATLYPKWLPFNPVLTRRPRASCRCACFADLS